MTSADDSSELAEARRRLAGHGPRPPARLQSHQPDVRFIRLFNDDQAARGKVQIQIGVGIASGRVVAGNAGTHQRVTYTCVGDTVHVAARLESHTKVVRRPILIDENTRRGLEDGIAVSPQGEVLMNGKTEPINVYAVLVDSLVAEGA